MGNDTETVLRTAAVQEGEINQIRVMEGERREVIGIQTMEQGCWKVEGARIRTSLPVKWEERIWMQINMFSWGPGSR